MRQAAAIGLSLGLTIASFGLAAEATDELSARETAKLQSFLRNYVKSASYDYKKTRYIARPASLQDHVRDVIVYLQDQYSCGSGGCTTLVLSPEGSSYRVVTSITVARLPIRLLDNLTNGWHDIGVWVQGGGIQPGYEAILSFNGRSYPSNPTTAPARRAPRLEGEVVMHRDVEGVLLYR